MKMLHPFVSPFLVFAHYEDDTHESAQSTINGRNGMNVLFWIFGDSKVIAALAIWSRNGAMNLWQY